MANNVSDAIRTTITAVADGGKTVGQVVRAVVVPPWKMPNIANHTAANVTALVATTILYYFTRQFTANPLFGIAPAIVGTVLAVFLLFGVGFVINLVDPTKRATALANRWSTFLIVSFFIELVFLAVGLGGIPLLIGLSYNPLDWLTIRLESYAGAGALVSAVAAAIATGWLYLRTRRYFSNLVAYSMPLTTAYVLLCAAANFAVLFFFVFVLD